MERTYNDYMPPPVAQSEPPPSVMTMEAPAIPKGPYIVKFGKSYTFEGKTYSYLDLSGMENMTSKDLFDVDRAFSQASGMVISTPEANPMYCCFIAQRCCRVPHEFFDKLSAKDTNRIKAVVLDFFQSEA